MNITILQKQHLSAFPYQKKTTTTFERTTAHTFYMDKELNQNEY